MNELECRFPALSSQTGSGQTLRYLWFFNTCLKNLKAVSRWKAFTEYPELLYLNLKPTTLELIQHSFGDISYEHPTC